MKKNQNVKDRTSATIIVTMIILVLIIAAGWFWSRMRSHPIVTPAPVAVAPEPPKPATESKAPGSLPETSAASDTSPQPGPVIRYDTSDEEFKKLMDRRKARFGLKDSVDMIVESGETVEIGGVAVPMEEILEKIRLKKGGIMESDIGPALATVNKGDRIDRLYSQLKEKERRFKELEKDIANAPVDAAGMAPRIKEYDELQNVVDQYHEYRDALTTIRSWELALESKNLQETLTKEVRSLEREKTVLEERLALAFDLTAENGPLQEQLLKTLAEYRARRTEIDKSLKTPPADIMARAALVRERIIVSEKIASLETYEQTIARIDQLRELTDESDLSAAAAAAKIEKALGRLRNRADELEDTLADRLLPDEKTEVYGIHVVGSGDNIWNIHFEFLKENFKYRGIILSRISDEPDTRGGSSGVGKILKFAEGMVYIYNLREHRLADDVSLIHPESKIIVFNMARAIDVIREIDMEDIKHIQFDGETLWLPSG